MQVTVHTHTHYRLSVIAGPLCAIHISWELERSCTYGALALLCDVMTDRSLRISNLLCHALAPTSGRPGVTRREKSVRGQCLCFEGTGAIRLAVPWRPRYLPGWGGMGSCHSVPVNGGQAENGKWANLLGVSGPQATALPTCDSVTWGHLPLASCVQGQKMASKSMCGRQTGS